MAHFLSDLDLIPLLRSKPSHGVMQVSDECCSPAHLFLAIAKIRSSSPDVREAELRLQHQTSKFHQHVGQCALTVVNVADGMGMMLDEDTMSRHQLMNHYAKTKSPPEATVEIVCREIANEYLGW